MSANKGQKVWIIGGFALGIVLLTRYLLPVVLPFLLGGALAYGAEPAANLLTKKFRFPRWAAAGISVTGFFILTLGLILLLISLLARQLGQLSGLLPQLAQAIGNGLASLEQWLLSLAVRLPQNMAQFLQRWVESLFSDSSAMLEQAAGRVSQMATGLMEKLGHFALVLFTAVLSGYMISARLPGIKAWCREKLPQVWQGKYVPAFRSLRKAVTGWLVAQGKLMVLTFVLLTAGFFLLRVPNTLLIAALVTLVDAFPILGTGTVLIPWSTVCLLQGDHARGVGLISLYIVTWLVRSVLEPRILGKELGLDPLITLFSVYAGFCVLGIGGMLIAPIVAMLVTQLIKHRAQ